MPLIARTTSEDCQLGMFLLLILAITEFVRVLENRESPGILLWHFPGLESPGKMALVLESKLN